MNILENLNFSDNKPATKSIHKSAQTNYLAIGLLENQILKKHKATIPTMLTVLKGEIQFYINSPGGYVTSGFSIYDTIQSIKSPVSTICTGLAASMGSLLLSAGKKGRRFIQPHARVMIHQPSGGAQGQASDIEITAKEIIKTKELSAKILAKNCGQKFDKVMKDFNRDHWMGADESVEYGIVDGIAK